MKIHATDTKRTITQIVFRSLQTGMATP
jgi:hypothetical protein